jgi:hypothetical protein
VVLGGPFFGKWEGEAVADARALLDKVLSNKRQKLRQVAYPPILLIRDAYVFADAAMLRDGLAGVDSVAAFHTVFLVTEGSGFVLYSREDIVSSRKGREQND